MLKIIAKLKTQVMTKRIFTTLLIFTAAGAVTAQDRHHQAPAAVQQSFHRDYPEARDPQWHYSNSHWNADFEDHSRYDRGEMVAHYDRYGRHVDSHIPYDRNDVPPAVVQKTERHFPDGRDYNYTRIEQPGRPALFQVSLNLRGSNRTVYLDDNGRERRYQHRH